MGSSRGGWVHTAKATSHSSLKTQMRLAGVDIVIKVKAKHPAARQLPGREGEVGSGHTAARQQRSQSSSRGAGCRSQRSAGGSINQLVRRLGVLPARSHGAPGLLISRRRCCSRCRLTRSRRLARSPAPCLATARRFGGCGLIGHLRVF